MTKQSIQGSFRRKRQGGADQRCHGRFRQSGGGGPVCGRGTGGDHGPDPLQAGKGRQGTGATTCLAGEPSSEEDVAKVVEAAVDAFGGIDILITAAGVNKPGAIHEQSIDEWQMIMDANVKGTYLFCKEAGRP